MQTHCYTDYYAVLEVPPDADLATIKNAYRAKAIQTHPDRHQGEDPAKWHSAMQQLNAAFAILSDPEKRRRHDEARANLSNQASRQYAEADRAQAREQAQQYPRNFQEFESWLDGLTHDFSKDLEGPGGGAFPLITNSVSGFLFVGGGFIAGIMIAGYLDEDGIHQYNGIAFGSLGALAGGALRMLIGASLRSAGSSSSQPTHQASFQQRPNGQNTPSHSFTNCPFCKRKLRFPVKPHEQKVRCPRCEFTFTVPPAVAATGTQPEMGGAVVSPENISSGKNVSPDRGVGVAVIAGIASFIILIFVCQISVGDGFFTDQTTVTNWPEVFIGTGVCAFIGYRVGKKM